MAADVKDAASAVIFLLYNCTVDKTTDFSPFFLMFERVLFPPIDIMLQHVHQDSKLVSHKKFVTRLRQDLNAAAKIVQKQPPGASMSCQMLKPSGWWIFVGWWRSGLARNSWWNRQEEALWQMGKGFLWHCISEYWYQCVQDFPVDIPNLSEDETPSSLKCQPPLLDLIWVFQLMEVARSQLYLPILIAMPKLWNGSWIVLRFKALLVRVTWVRIYSWYSDD